ncbi:MAG: hydroxyphenylacetyl-CoA thioesterase PaaI [Nitriliruptoraceae bacterium]
MSQRREGAVRGAAAADPDAPIDPAIAMLAADDASGALGMELLEVRPGFARVAMPVVEGMLNGHGIAHGGVVFTLADTAFGAACNSGRPMTVATSAEIDFLAPVQAGDRLIAEAVERASTGRNGITDVTVWREGDEPLRVAEFRGRSRTIGDRGAS